MAMTSHPHHHHHHHHHRHHHQQHQQQNPTSTSFFFSTPSASPSPSSRHASTFHSNTTPHLPLTTPTLYESMSTRTTHRRFTKPSPPSRLVTNATNVRKRKSTLAKDPMFWKRMVMRESDLFVSYWVEPPVRMQDPSMCGHQDDTGDACLEVASEKPVRIHEPLICGNHDTGIAERDACLAVASECGLELLRLLEVSEVERVTLSQTMVELQDAVDVRDRMIGERNMEVEMLRKRVAGLMRMLDDVAREAALQPWRPASPTSPSRWR
ncbi:hypothetical protein BC829DRAFT_412101 [Chytridium lagenaria]|nr:hypothetical protein BC829DRAFT_412101 [Chytridium lagenaria]